MADKRPALGRGLSALIPDAPPAPSDKPLEIDTDLLRPNPYQPRGQMDEARLQDLSRSVRANGVIQPIIVRRAGDRYEIIAGERRWRAAQLAGVLKVPVVVREVPDGKLLETALVENIQREDLNPIEEATAYRRLVHEFKLTQEQVADEVGKDRSSVANYMRLLRLPEEIRAEIASGTLAMGHARAILAIEDGAAQRRAAREIIARGLSVREAEALVKRLVEPPRKPAAKPTDPNTRAAEARLRFALGTRVRIVRKGKGGRLEIEFTSEQELNRIYEVITGKA